MNGLSGFIAATILIGFMPGSLFGHSYGPPPRVTGAPGDNPRACTLCHSGSSLNSGTGSVKILLQSGPVYVPGIKQRVAVQVTDPVQRRWGFELTARLNSDLEQGQAGEFTPVDNMTQVICEDNAPLPCASGPSFIEHTSAGTRNGTSGGAIFQFDWTPPATSAGPVTFYVAGNAANGNGSSTGDLIYTSSVELTPALPVAPTVTAGSIVSAATFTPSAMGPNCWATVYGSHLGVTNRSWSESDFLNGALPASLDGVSVVLKVFGAPRLAYIGYVSPNQVNFLLPSDLLPGTATVQVRNPAGISTPVTITVQGSAPQVFTVDGSHVMGVHANGTSLSTAPALPGETLILYGTGLGATSPGLIPGQLPADSASLVTPPQVTIGKDAAKVISAGIVPGNAGVYQIEVQVPSNAVNGDLPLTVQVGAAVSSSVLLTIGK